MLIFAHNFQSSWWEPHQDIVAWSRTTLSNLNSVSVMILLGHKCNVFNVIIDYKMQICPGHTEFSIHSKVTLYLYKIHSLKLLKSCLGKSSTFMPRQDRTKTLCRFGKVVLGKVMLKWWGSHRLNWFGVTKPFVKILGIWAALNGTCMDGLGYTLRIPSNKELIDSSVQKWIIAKNCSVN